MTAKRLGLYKSNRLNDERCDLIVQSYQKKQQLVRTKQCCLILRLQQQGSVDLGDVANFCNRLAKERKSAQNGVCGYRKHLPNLPFHFYFWKYQSIQA